jgi:hypothetical protein
VLVGWLVGRLVGLTGGAGAVGCVLFPGGPRLPPPPPDGSGPHPLGGGNGHGPQRGGAGGT